jgi:peptide chain release factor 1
MREKLKSILDKYQSLTDLIHSPDIMNEVGKFKKISRELKHLSPIADAAKQYMKICAEIDSSRELVESDDTEHELRDMAYEE